MNRVTSAYRGVVPRSSGQRRRAALDALVASSDRSLQTSFMLDGSLASRRFYELFIDSGYHEIASDMWPCEIKTLGDVPNTIFRDGETIVTVLPSKALAHVTLSFGWFHIRVAAPTADIANGTCTVFRQHYPAAYLIEADGFTRVPITFWALGRFGPEPRLRKIDSASWADIEGNYAVDVKDELARLAGWSNGPDADGQLILWQGPPGTGKTWALRALATEWARWAEFHYITDPDSFFVTDPSYMVNVLLADSYSVIEEASGDVVETEDPEGKWRVLILEDTGELLAANAKEQYGQGLSRLLNVVDGMIGQGLRVLALVTTNDELGDLHEAVTRPGRCASKIEFGPLSDDEAKAWTGQDDATGGTIADLYARYGKAESALPDDSAVAASADRDFAALLDLASRPL